MATEAQLAEIRLLSGDNAPTSVNYVVSDAIISSWFTANSDSICATVVQVVQAMLADASRDLGGSGETVGSNPKAQQLREYLMYVRENCPDSIQGGSIISINLGIDEEIDLYDIE